jgi:enoyl-CoA hydratase
MSYEAIIYEKSNGVATITFNRTQALNALTMKMMDEILSALKDAEGDIDTRVVVLTGSGRGFCVGADLKEVASFAGDAVKQRAFYQAGPNMYGAIESLTKPVIGVVNGVATAGGFEILLYCDIVIAADDARIGDTHANFVGIGPFACTMAPRKMGYRKAVELCLTGDIWSAADCEKAGLVNYVVPKDKLADKVKDITSKLTNKMPLGLASTKTVLRQALDGNLNSVLKLALRESAAISNTQDFAEGMKAFAEKRKPNYKGQ